MRLRRLATAIATASLALTGVAASPDAGELTEEGYLVVGVDAEGDWGDAAGASDASQLGASAGQDLLSAAVGLDPEDASVIHFVIGVSDLSNGGTPEVTRYTWNFDVDGEFAELDGKFTNYSRGACDPTSGACPPPRDPGPQPFTLRGNCTTTDGANVTTCEELARVQAIFDASAGTITIPVPMDLLGATACTKITGGVNLFGGSISAAPSAFFTSSLMPLDTMDVLKKWFVPNADGTDCVPEA